MEQPRKPAPPTPYGDQLRAQAAAAAASADASGLLERFEALEAAGEDMSVFREQALRSARFIRQVGSVQAAQALAYDEFVAAGGESNPEARAAYREATERNNALLPADDLKWDPPPPKGP